MRILFAAIGIAVALCSQAMAQPDPSRFFGYLDRNQDGRIDGDEIQRIPGPFRDAMQNARVDLSRGLSRDDFSRIIPRVMEDMRRRREESGGGFGGGPPGGRDGYRGGGDGRGPGDYRGGDRRDYGRGDSRRREPEKPKRWMPKTRDRVTLDLGDSWKDNDINGDGQIGLYEWDRAKLAEFLRLDINGDGLLTPREISFASEAAPAPTSKTVVASRSQTAPSKSAAAKPATPSQPAAPTSGGSISPAEFDAESSEGRWARYVFRRLDGNRDGTLDADEWQKSQSTRKSFEKHGAQVSLPADFDKFAPWLVAVQRAEKKR